MKKETVKASPYKKTKFGMRYMPKKVKRSEVVILATVEDEGDNDIQRREKLRRRYKKGHLQCEERAEVLGETHLKSPREIVLTPRQRKALLASAKPKKITRSQMRRKKHNVVTQPKKWGKIRAYSIPTFNRANPYFEDRYGSQDVNPSHRW